MEIGGKGTSYLKSDFSSHWLVLRKALKAPKNFSRKQQLQRRWMLDG